MARLKPFWVRLWLAVSLFLALAIVGVSSPFNRIATIPEAIEEVGAPGIPAVECSGTTTTITLEEQDGTRYHFCFASQEKINQFFGAYSKAQGVANTKKSISHLVWVSLKIFVAMLVLAILGFLADWVARGAERGFLFSSTDSQPSSVPLTGIGLSPQLKLSLHSARRLIALTFVAFLSYLVFLDSTWVYKGLSAFGDKPLAGFMLALPLLIISKRGPHWFQVICAYQLFVVPAVLLWYPIEMARGDLGIGLYGALSIFFIEIARYVSPQLLIGPGRFSSRRWQIAFAIPTLLACAIMTALLDDLFVVF